MVRLTFEQRQAIKQAISNARKLRIRREINTANGSQNPYRGRLKSPEAWAAEGLEEIEPGISESNVRCTECRKESRRTAPRKHYIFCSRWVPRDRPAAERKERRQREQQTQQAA